MGRGELLFDEAWIGEAAMKEEQTKIIEEYMLEYIDGVECWHWRHDAGTSELGCGAISRLANQGAGNDYNQELRRQRPEAG